MQGDIGQQCLNNKRFKNSCRDASEKKLEVKQEEVGKIAWNVRNILRDLERSIKKSSQYEQQFSAKSLYECHSHLHTDDGGYQTERNSKVSFSEKNFLFNIAPDVSRREVNLAHSWSTMSIVCLQYQYDELTRKYQNLLKVHDDRCQDLSSRDSSLADCRLQLDAILDELMSAQEVVHKVCSKYLALKKRKERDVGLFCGAWVYYIPQNREQAATQPISCHFQNAYAHYWPTFVAEKQHYEQKISALEKNSSSLLRLLWRSREEVERLVRSEMEDEREPARAQLLAEIRRSNQLFQENLRLKARLQELAPGTVEWSTDHW